jgi:hypothetical protein
MAFVVLYALHAIGCAFAWQSSALRLALVLVLLLHLVVIGWMWRHQARGVDPAADQTSVFLHTVTVWTVISALAVTALTLGPPLVLATCI